MYEVYEMYEAYAFGAIGPSPPLGSRAARSVAEQQGADLHGAGPEPEEDMNNQQGGCQTITPPPSAQR